MHVPRGTLIDAFTHFLPRQYIEAVIRLDSAPHLVSLAKRFSNISALCDVTARLDLVGQFPSLKQVLSLALPTPEMVADPSESAKLARLANDCLADIVRNQKKSFPAFLASLPMGDVPAALKEMERSVSELGARGFQILTSIGGLPLDHPKFLPIFEQAASLDAPIFLHPFRTDRIPDYPSEAASEFEISNVLGWPHETSVAMARLVFSEVTSKFPQLKIVAHHLGGTIPYLAGRVGPMWDQLGLRSGNQTYAEIRKRLGVPPIQCLKSFFADTAVADANALRCGIGFFGVDRVLFASDAPFGPDGGRRFIEDNIGALADAGLTPEQYRKVAETNARLLLKL